MREIGSSNGRINVQDATKSVMARTSNGSVTIVLTEEATGPVEARTSNGAVSLELGNSFEGVLELENSNGRLELGSLPKANILSVDKHHMRLKFDSADKVSKLKTRLSPNS